MSSEEKPNRPTRLLAVAAALLGVAGLAAFAVFVLLNGLGLWPRREPASGAGPWLVNVGWLVAFALQHSGMARRPFKDWLTRWLPAALERPSYVAASGLLTLLVPIVWQPLPGPNLWEGPAWLIGVSLAAAVATGLQCRTFDSADFLGLRFAPGSTGPLHVTGAYRWVRHPLMTGTLIFLWTQPIMTPELLLLDAGLTVYILAALPLEERELVRQFGSDYERYRRRTPALVPWRWPSRSEESA